MKQLVHTHTQSHRLQVADDAFKTSLLSQQNEVQPGEQRESSMEQPDQLIAVSIYPLCPFDHIPHTHINWFGQERGVVNKAFTQSKGVEILAVF